MATSEKKLEQVVCTTKCMHGKLWNVGEKTSVRTLEILGGAPYPEEHFSPIDSPKAQEVSEKSQTKKEKLRAFLISKRVTPPPRATLKQLEELADKIRAKKSNNPLD